MKPEKHCKVDMVLINATARCAGWDLFFQCKKCKEIIVVNKPEHFNTSFNKNLDEYN